jgi:hypothetical protein
MHEIDSSEIMGTTLLTLLRAASEDGEPIRVTVEETTYELAVREVGRDDIWAGYDPEAARKAWLDSAGILKGVDADQIIARLREERSQDGFDVLEP